MAPDVQASTRWTRRQFVSRSAGVGLALAGIGYGADRIVAGDDGRADGGSVAPTGVHTFHSRPDLMPPTVSVEPRSGAVAPGRLFLAPFNATTGVRSHAQQGALIIDDDGEPIWFQPVSPRAVMNLRVAAYKGEPVLTWWEGTTVARARRGVARDRRRLLSRARALPRRRRAPVGPARVPGDAAGHRSRDGVGEGRDRPAQRRRPRARQGRGRDRAGARHPERDGAVRVAKPRPRLDRGRAEGVGDQPLRLLPHQRGRPRRRRQHPRLVAQHVDGVQGRPGQRRDHLAPGRQAKRLPDGAGDALCLAARRARAPEPER